MPLRLEVDSGREQWWAHGNSDGIGDHDVANKIQAYKVDSGNGDGALSPRYLRSDHLLI